MTTPGGGHLGWAAGGGGPFGEPGHDDKDDAMNLSQSEVMIPVPSRQWHSALWHHSHVIVHVEAWAGPRMASHVGCPVQVGPGLMA